MTDGAAKRDALVARCMCGREIEAVQDSERLSRLIGDIYDAALNPSAWPRVLGETARFVGGSAASLISKDASRKSGTLHYHDGGIAPAYVRLYFDKYIKIDPVTTAHYFADAQEPVATADLLPYEEFVATRFYKEWAQPQGLVDFISAVIEKSATSVAMFGVFRHARDGMVDEDTRRRMRLVVPHIRRAVLIGGLIDLKSLEASTFAKTLDGMSAGLMLVDASGRIVHANAAAHKLLAAGDPLRAAEGHLVANDTEVSRTLRDSFAAAGSGDAATGLSGIAIPVAAEDGVQWVAHLLPLTSGERRHAGVTYSAVAALFVRKAALGTLAPPEAIAKAFRLTPSELRVLLAIVEVGGLPEVAEALGVADSTVKTHLARVYEKTGARRHVDLVKLIAGYSSPFTG